MIAALWGSHALAQIPNFSLVDQQIYRGGRPDAAGLRELGQMQIKVDLDIENAPAIVAKERSAAQKDGLVFKADSFEWMTPPTDAQVDRILKALQDPANLPIFLHCHHGEDRTGLLIGLYRVRVQGWPPEKAYQEMLDRGFHPSIHALDNYFRKKTGYSGK